MKQQLKQLSRERYNWPSGTFDRVWDKVESLTAFAADQNIFESGQEICEEELLLIRMKTEYHISQALDAALILKDDNLEETAKRIAKMWCGDSLNCDSELGGGRFSLPVRIPTFPNTRGNDKWITKEVRIVSTCSHHFLPFTGTAIISYKPNKFVLGISKLQRLANYVANRFWLQEDLTGELHKKLVEAAQVSDDDVKVQIVAQHGCERDRGVKNLDCDFTTYQ